MPEDIEFMSGRHDAIACHCWETPNPRYQALLVHGYGEHLGRYQHVAAALQERGARVFGPDHRGHGLSGGERVLIEDFDDVVDDVHALVRRQIERFPASPLVVIGHSMGGMIATRYVQRFGGDVRGLVLSAPLLGAGGGITGMLALPEIPDIPLDPSTLSRDVDVVRAYETDPLVWHGPFKRPMLEALRDILSRIADGPGFGDRPTLWLHGDADRLVPMDETRSGLDRLKGSRFEADIVREGRHELFNDIDREATLRRTVDFIETAIVGSPEHRSS